MAGRLRRCNIWAAPATSVPIVKAKGRQGKDDETFKACGWPFGVDYGFGLDQLSPLIGIYSTKITDALDCGVITPATFIAGLLILWRNPLGYLVAFSLLILEVILTPLLVAQTSSQLLVGITFTPAEIIGPIIGFALLGLFALWVLVILLRKTTEPARKQAPTLQPV